MDPFNLVITNKINIGFKLCRRSNAHLWYRVLGNLYLLGISEHVPLSLHHFQYLQQLVHKYHYPGKALS